MGEVRRVKTNSCGESWSKANTLGALRPSPAQVRSDARTAPLDGLVLASSIDHSRMRYAIIPNDSLWYNIHLSNLTREAHKFKLL